MRTTKYNVGDIVVLSDGKRYKYLGSRQLTGKTVHAYEPLENSDFALVKDDKQTFAPFSDKTTAYKPGPSAKKKWYVKFLDWWVASNRWKHLLFAIPLGAVCGADFTVGVGLGMEIKDHLYGEKADFMDFALTAVGGLIGHGAMRLVGLDYLIKFLINLIF